MSGSAASRARSGGDRPASDQQHVLAERRKRVAAVIEFLVRVSNVVEMDTCRSDTARRCRGRRRSVPPRRGNRRQVEAFDLRRLVLVYRRGDPDIRGCAGRRRRGPRPARHHQPFRVSIDDVIASDGSSPTPATRLTFTQACARPGVVRARSPARADRVPAGRPAPGSRLETALIVRIAAAANLHEKGIEAARLCRAHHRLDRRGRRKARTHHPQRTHLGLRVQGQQRRNGKDQRRACERGCTAEDRPRHETVGE